jgi:protein-tyrosine phosphatase
MGRNDRATTLGGCPNFRHMGDYTTDDGRMTRRDRLFRSGWLDLAAPSESDRFTKYGIQRVFDFRLDAEQAQQPVMFPTTGAPTVTRLGIDRGSMGPHIQNLATPGALSSDTRRVMAQMYYEMLDEGRDRFQAFLREAAESEGPLMIMCTLGKDRTGVASALLLTALGVQWKDVLRDYMITARTLRGYDEIFAQRANFAARGIELESVRDMLTVHPEYLESMHRRALEISGSLDAFLESQLALSSKSRKRLRDLYTR